MEQCAQLYPSHIAQPCPRCAAPIVWLPFKSTGRYIAVDARLVAPDDAAFDHLHHTRHRHAPPPPAPPPRPSRPSKRPGPHAGADVDAGNRPRASRRQPVTVTIESDTVFLLHLACRLALQNSESETARAGYHRADRELREALPPGHTLALTPRP